MKKTFKDYLKIVQESEQKLNTDLLRSILEKIKLELEVQLNKSDEYGNDWEEESIEIKKGAKKEIERDLTNSYKHSNLSFSGLFDEIFTDENTYYQIIEKVEEALQDINNRKDPIIAGLIELLGLEK